MSRDLGVAFDNITDGEATMSTATFASVVRAATGEQNLFNELRMYQTFNVSGTCMMTREEFITGVIASQDARLKQGLLSFATEAAVAL